MLRGVKKAEELTPHNEPKTNTTRGKKDSKTYPLNNARASQTKSIE